MEIIEIFIFTTNLYYIIAIILDLGNSLHNKIYLAGILLVLMFACSIEAHAQRVVRGTVVDSLSSSGLPAANAVLLNKDSSFVNGLPTDSAGHFKC